ncbi:MAG TPA: methyltransferase domain-containing protein [Stellaceae bacterium]|nr:methyltransferase domain-containing protein [Stellaceae bacterium]
MNDPRVSAQAEPDGLPGEASSDWPRGAFLRADESRDAEFYRLPRFVHHIDPGAVQALSRLYRRILPPDGALLDLMSSWVSHLPDDIAYRRIAGLGMNAEELAGNPRLTDWTVQDLNREPYLPYPAGSFDAAVIAVSVQYLVRPVEVFAEIGRVLTSGGPLVVSFSNRCFPTKAVAAWRVLDDRGRIDLVRRYFTRSGAWRDVTVLDGSSGDGDPLFVVTGRRI